MTIAARFLPAIPLAALLLAGAAQAESRASAVVSAQAGYGSDPFYGSSGNQDSSGSVVVSAAPTMTFLGPTSNVSLTGNIEHTFFSRQYSDLTNWTLGGNAGVQLGPNSSFALAAVYASTINSGLATSINTSLPTPDDTIPLPDPSAAELVGQRSRTLSSNASFSTALAAHTSLSLSANVSKADYPSAFGSNYVSYGGSASVSHVFNSKLNAGLGLSFSKTDYDQAGFGSFRVFSPNVQATARLSPRTTLSVSAGISINDTAGPVATPSTAHFSGNASLCHAGTRSNLCLVASRAVGTTAQQGNSTITALGANYSYTLTPRSSITLDAQYSDSASITTGPSFESAYVNTSAGYSRQLTRRLSLTANVRYTNPFKSVGDLRANFYGGVGVSYRFGR